MDWVWVQPPPSPVTAKTLSRCLWMGWGHAHRWGSPWELSRRPLPQGLVGTVTLPALKGYPLKVGSSLRGCQKTQLSQGAGEGDSVAL